MLVILYQFAKTAIVNSPIPYSLLPTPYSLLPTPYSLLLTPYSLLPSMITTPTTQLSDLLDSIDLPVDWVDRKSVV